jgi:hypothetical protein
MSSPNTNIDDLDKILQLAGNLAIKTANKYLEDDFKLGLIERLKLPEETDFTSAKTQLEALLSAAVEDAMKEISSDKRQPKHGLYNQEPAYNAGYLAGRRTKIKDIQLNARVDELRRYHDRTNVYDLEYIEERIKELEKKQ